MTAQTGRTVSDFTKLLISNGASMVDLKVDSLGDLGFDYPTTEMSAWSDAIKGVLVGKPGVFELDFGGPIDNTATTGPSTILRSKVGSNTASSFDVQIGVRQTWVDGEQQFGMTADISDNFGVIITSYKEAGGKYTAHMAITPGSPLPAWATTAEAVPSA